LEKIRKRREQRKERKRDRAVESWIKRKKIDEKKESEERQREAETKRMR
jgi:hypothetical protein